MSKSKPLTEKDGELRELNARLFERAKRGRPMLTKDKIRVLLIFTLEPDVAAALRAAVENASERVNRLLRADLGL